MMGKLVYCPRLGKAVSQGVYPHGLDLSTVLNAYRRSVMLLRLLTVVD
jgi:hypothetical protein